MRNCRIRWARQEGARPERGRHGWGSEQAYEENPGRWSAQAWAVMHPWSVENPTLGPTFNSWINGVAYWQRGGARQDGADRYGATFGPQPLNEENPTAAIDVTAVLAGNALGETSAQRLRALESQGFIVHKKELYDLKYTSQMPWVGHDGVYDWRVSTGYLRIWVDEPVLAVTLRPVERPAQVEPLPPAVDVSRLAEELRAGGVVGEPSIAFPDDYAERVRRFMEKPENMPQWQWERIQELRRIGGGTVSEFERALFSLDREQYLAAMQKILAQPPRTWTGHRTPDVATIAHAYGELMPDGVMDHIKLYWQAFRISATSRACRAPASTISVDTALYAAR